ncbi:MAG: helix-turn-helix domain-containing protein [Opitutaceae bacterium]|nr:helix-turn-helix domain-containing protein [Opitutaceae bacterium]
MKSKNQVPLPSQQDLETLKQAQAIAVKPPQGWLRAMRTALGLSQKHVADQITMTRQAYADLESAEVRGAISLKSLHRAAGAMDCDLVYFVVPRSPAAIKAVPQSPTPASPPPPVSAPTTAFEDKTTGDLQIELK